MGYFLGVRLSDEERERLDALSAALGLAGNRSATVKTLLDAPISALVLATNVTAPGQKETARQVQTGGTAARATGDGVNRLSIDTRDQDSHVTPSLPRSG